MISCWLASLILIVDLLTNDLPASARRRREAIIHAPEKTPRPTAPRNDSTFIRQLLKCSAYWKEFFVCGFDGAAKSIAALGGQQFGSGFSSVLAALLSEILHQEFHHVI